MHSHRLAGLTAPETIEREMTALIRARIKAKTGVTIGDAEWQDEEP